MVPSKFELTGYLKFVNYTCMWGCSSVGRAQRSQCWGQGFDSPHLHFPLLVPISLFANPEGNCIRSRPFGTKSFLNLCPVRVHWCCRCGWSWRSAIVCSYAGCPDRAQMRCLWTLTGNEKGDWDWRLRLKLNFSHYHQW